LVTERNIVGKEGGERKEREENRHLNGKQEGRKKVVIVEGRSKSWVMREDVVAKGEKIEPIAKGDNIDDKDADKQAITHTRKGQ
jgi:hypothetical protein